jgi:hypothetical protein
MGKASQPHHSSAGGPHAKPMLLEIGVDHQAVRGDGEDKS